MKKLLFVLLAAGSVAASSCDWWDPYPDPNPDPWDPPIDTIKPWDPTDPRDTTNDGGGGGGIGDTIIIIDDPWGPADSNWWDPRDTN